jgi:hypothetical protein
MFILRVVDNYLLDIIQHNLHVLYILCVVDNYIIIQKKPTKLQFIIAAWTEIFIFVSIDLL